ncbi:MAG: pentapeptide repeat-containing protein [Alphaproteobacteria bacterium]|nr:pentapeptide repeat-containing protein [Alphaproteobacteria bacterium]
MTDDQAAEAIRDILTRAQWDLLVDYARGFKKDPGPQGYARFLRLHGAVEPAEASARLHAALSVHPLSADYPEVSDSNMDHGFAWSLAASNSPPDDWDEQLARHRAFVDALRAETGSPGWGQWQVLEVSGMPLGLWQGPAVEAGAQLSVNLPNLTGLPLRGAILAWACLAGLHAPEQDLSGADLAGALLTDSQLDGCDFTGADLRKADLSRSSLRGACFKDANLEGCDFEGCDLRGADLSGAQLRGALFTGARGVKR